LSSSNETVGAMRRSDTVKLPRLNIEKYYGDLSKWQSFWSQFDVSVQNNNSITKTEKFTYLKSYLGGAALSAILGLIPSDVNYDVAVNFLKQRF